MINYDPAYAAELLKEAIADIILVRFDFATPAYITDSDIPVLYDSNLYLPTDVTYDSLTIAAALSVDKVTLEIANADMKWSAYLLAADQRGKQVVISRGIRVPGTLHVQDLFYGILDFWRIKETRVEITVVNELVLWNKRALRTSPSSCPWAFKQAGGECGYTGSETWCDQSWERCEALSNHLNFGGERFINATMEKETWWGKTPRK